MAPAPARWSNQQGSHTGSPDPKETDMFLFPEINVAQVTQNATAVGILGNATAVNSSVVAQG